MKLKICLITLSLLSCLVALISEDKDKKMFGLSLIVLSLTFIWTFIDYIAEQFS